MFENRVKNCVESFAIEHDCILVTVNYILYCDFLIHFYFNADQYLCGYYCKL